MHNFWEAVFSVLIPALVIVIVALLIGAGENDYVAGLCLTPGLRAK